MSRVQCVEHMLSETQNKDSKLQRAAWQVGRQNGKTLADGMAKPWHGKMAYMLWSKKVVASISRLSPALSSELFVYGRQHCCHLSSVLQNDIHAPATTVYEALEFSAQMRILNLNKQKLKNFVDQVSRSEFIVIVVQGFVLEWTMLTCGTCQTFAMKKCVCL